MPSTLRVGQLREFESLRVHARKYKFVGTFSCAQIDSRKARERALATFDEKRRAVGMLSPTREDTVAVAKTSDS